MITKYHNSRLNIGVIIDKLEGRYQSRIWKQLASQAIECDCNILFFEGQSIHSPMSDDAQYNTIYGLINTNLLDGLLVLGGSLSNYITALEFQEFLKPYLSIPIVNIGLLLPGVVSIITNNSQGVQDAVYHLIDKHQKKRIGFIRGPECHQEANERLLGYQQALEAKGLKPDPSLIFEGDFTRITGMDQFKKALENGCLFDSLIVANDQMAIQAMDNIRQAGLRIPEDVAVIGFDDVHDMLFQEPAGSSIRQPFEEMAVLAFEQLLAMINGQDTTELTTVPLQLMPRESCGCLSTETSNSSSEGNYSKHFCSKYKEIGRERMQISRIVWNARNLIQEMNSAQDLHAMIEKLGSKLPNVGISKCFIALYDMKGESQSPGVNLPAKYSRLVMAYDNRGVFINENTSIEFITRKILPDGILAPDYRYSLIIEPLLNKDTQFGYVVMEYSAPEEMVYGLLREQISNFLRIDQLFHERLKAEEKLIETLAVLKESEEKYRDMAVLLPTIILETDLSLRITFLNKVGLSVFGMEEAGLSKHLMITQYVHPADKKRLEEYCSGIISGSVPVYNEFRLCPQEDLSINLISKATPIFKNSNIIGIRWSALDIKPLLDVPIQLADSFYQKYQLSSREKEVLHLLLRGNTSKEMAQKLFISEGTVKDHISSIYSKVGVHHKKEFLDLVQEFQKNRFGYESIIFMLLKNYLNG